jgi:hypothetical protein
MPFVAPAEPAPAPAGGPAIDADQRDVRVEATAAAVPIAAMAWPARREVEAALVLESLARRLRAGRFRLPVAVDPASVPAAIAAVLAAVHADEAATAAAAGEPAA